MEVILLKDVEKVGKKGEVVQVRDGFGRNYLLPRVLALQATRENRAGFENEKKSAVRRRGREKAAAEALSERLSALKLTVEVEAGEKDKLFGAVTASDLAEALKAQGVVVDKKQIVLPEPIKTLGLYEVALELDREVRPTLRVEVVKKKSP